MPTYNVDLTTDRGLNRVPFTLDDDRPLGPQVHHILEELRQRGLVLRGGPDDELAVRWNGREVDGTKTPEGLGLNALYPIELRMRSRRAAPAAERRPEPPATPVLPRGGYVGMVSGLTGAALAWAASAFLLVDLPAFLPNYGMLDVVVAGLLFGLIGGFVVGFAELAQARSFGVGFVSGLGLGGLGAGLGCFLGGSLAGPLGFAQSRQGFLIARIVIWVLSGGLAGLLIGAFFFPRDRRRVLDGLLFGGAAALTAALIMSLPGRTDLWQMLAFTLVGGGLGFGLVGPSVRRGAGVLELETVAGRSAGLLRHRWWPIPDNGATAVAGRFEIRSVQGRCTVVAAAGTALQLQGKPVAGSAELLNRDVVALAESQFHFRRFPGGGI